jgi:hypothetical protein
VAATAALSRLIASPRWNRAHRSVARHLVELTCYRETARNGGQSSSDLQRGLAVVTGKGFQLNLVACADNLTVLSDVASCDVRCPSQPSALKKTIDAVVS